MGTGTGALVVWAFLVIECAVAVTYSSRLIHRFSDEVKAFRVSAKGGDWPDKRSLEYYRMLVSSDVERQKVKLGPQSPFLFPSEGSQTRQLGNDFGWLHYTWIDIGMPSVSFLVALDCGSDLLWVPCDCSQCAPLSASYYSILDKDLNEYSPSGSSTSKQLSCSHQLCELGSNCKNPKEPCPYSVNYHSENVSSSGLLVEDILHLASRKADASNSYIRTPVIIGCGQKQTGDYLNGIAPDGLMGLGLGEISVPSFLAKAGVVRNSFSLCFDEDDSGRIYFGDQGISTQQTTPFLPLDETYITYITGVEACCISSSCLEQTSFKALVDSGTSFTYLLNDVYERVAKEFDRRVNASKTSFEGYPWQYCYKSSSLELLKVPSVRLKFALNKSFVDLSYVDFSYACLKNVFFSRANLQCAKFRDVDAEGSIFHNATLRECEFTGANLRGALLAGTNLQSANLQDACLIDCSLCGADLRSAHLQTADLTNANLEGANLEGANLKGAKLFNANLKGANLQRAYLRHVNLRDTQLEGAKLDGANLLGAIR